MNGELMLLTRTANDRKWLQANMEKLREKFEKQFVAIEEEKIIAVNKDLEKLVEEVKKQGKNPAIIIIEYIYEKGALLIL